jgi:hypothetical protein
MYYESAPALRYLDGDPVYQGGIPEKFLMSANTPAGSAVTTSHSCRAGLTAIVPRLEYVLDRLERLQVPTACKRKTTGFSSFQHAGHPAMRM